MPQRRQDPALRHQNRILYFGFIRCQQLRAIPMNQLVGSASLIRFILWPAVSMSWSPGNGIGDRNESSTTTPRGG
jgi:hypothetical protein